MARIKSKQIDFSPAVVTATPVKFAGSLAGAAGAVTRYWSDEGSVADSSANSVAYPSGIPQTAVAIFAQIDSNNLATSSVIALAKNGVLTGLSFAVLSGVTGQLSATGSVSLIETDTYGLIVTNTAGGGGNSIRGTVTVVFNPPVP